MGVVAPDTPGHSSSVIPLKINHPPGLSELAKLSRNRSACTGATKIAVANGAPSVPAFTVLLGIYLVGSLILSLFVNIANRRLKLVER